MCDPGHFIWLPCISQFQTFYIVSVWLLLQFSKFQIMKIIRVRKQAKIRNQCNQVPHLTQDTIWETDKNTRKHHIQESQEISPSQQLTTMPQQTHKTARQTRNTNNKKESQKKHETQTAKRTNRRIIRHLTLNSSIFCEWLIKIWAKIFLLSLLKHVQILKTSYNVYSMGKNKKLLKCLY